MFQCYKNASELRVEFRVSIIGGTVEFYT